MYSPAELGDSTAISDLLQNALNRIDVLESKTAERDLRVQELEVSNRQLNGMLSGALRSVQALRELVFKLHPDEVDALNLLQFPQPLGTEPVAGENPLDPITEEMEVDPDTVGARPKTPLFIPSSSPASVLIIDPLPSRPASPVHPERPRPPSPKHSSKSDKEDAIVDYSSD